MDNPCHRAHRTKDIEFVSDEVFFLTKIIRQFESMEALFEYSNQNPSLFFSCLLSRLQKSNTTLLSVCLGLVDYTAG